ncbi:hypothetical protein KAR91_06130 [Candidatus Pacearchaeota archaeon]|nr:hypothetical protein [Candidatus Pacearchaeota archaeon]
MKAIDITGQTFGRLTAIEFSHSHNRKRHWKCRCECGTLKNIGLPELREGALKAVGV